MVLTPELMEENESGTQGMERVVAEELERYERIIQERLQAFFEIGIALQTIRDKRLYRLQFENFDDYCALRWEFTRSRAGQLIRSGQVNENLRQLTDGSEKVPLPQNESQARILSRYEPGEQLEIWKFALDTAPNGRMTAAHLQKCAAERERGASTGSAAAPQRDSYSSGGRLLERTLCLFCREEDVVIYPLGNTRQGICESCTEKGIAFHVQMKKESGR